MCVCVCKCVCVCGGGGGGGGDKTLCPGASEFLIRAWIAREGSIKPVLIRRGQVRRISNQVTVIVLAGGLGLTRLVFP